MTRGMGSSERSRQAHLSKIGLVDSPAYPQSTIEARYQDDLQDDQAIQEEEQSASLVLWSPFSVGTQPRN